MTKENIARFIDTAMTDKALAEKLAVLAAENGYDFTAEELLELGEVRPLSDADAEKAAAGATSEGPFFWPPLKPNDEGREGIQGGGLTKPATSCSPNRSWMEDEMESRWLPNRPVIR